ncbi:MAG: phosphoenolpyruvate--protein phosphotransferase, partial [Eubacterium sp.]|nr:phosphoenolpyruvate--protein phosphotransferase [Eubacterium sp.]
ENMVLVNPDEEKVKKAELHQKELLSIREEQRQSSEQIATKTKIYANISSPEEIEILSNNGADGIGLLRSEFLFLNRANAPTEEEQFEAYSYVVKAMKGKEIIIRTMDIGSDKQANWMKLPKELNPALGMRGLRISLANKELFRTQLRAILRTAKHGNVRIMLPMVTSLWEFEEAEKEISLAAESFQRMEKYTHQ